jgi:transcriptional regulator with XRE-family HTH domain
MVVHDDTTMDTATPAERESGGRRHLLSDFLRDRRQALKPEDVGLPVSRGPRRVTGLRREEVAVLADVGITWYTWLEQGRPIRVAPHTLERIADALRLDRHERTYLNLLVFGNTAQPPSTDPLPPGLVAVVRSYAAGPAYVLGPRWDVLAWNDVFTRVFRFPQANSENRNAIRHAFLNPAMTALFADWPAQARSMVATFRVNYAGHVGDDAFESLVAELIAKSPLFAELWRESEVLTPTDGRTAKLRDGAAQLLLYSGVTLIVPDFPETTVVFGLIEVPL